MLDPRVVEKIIETGDYWEDEFDFEKKELVLTRKAREWFSEVLGIKNIDSSFVDLYSFYVGGCGPCELAPSLYTLEEVLESYKLPLWAKDYPGFEKRYLQLSSIEGDHSLFFDKNTDYVFGVESGEIGRLVAGEIAPKFKSFDGFLLWYFSIE